MTMGGSLLRAILFDAPPSAARGRVQYRRLLAKEKRYRPLGSCSPVVQTLAKAAVRRLRQAHAHLCPPAADQQLAAIRQSDGTADRRYRAHGRQLAARPLPGYLGKIPPCCCESMNGPYCATTGPGTAIPSPLAGDIVGAMRCQATERATLPGSGASWPLRAVADACSCRRSARPTCTCYRAMQIGIISLRIRSLVRAR